MSGMLFATAWTVHTVFHIKNMHFGAFMVVLMGTIYELSIMLFEVPTGVIADVVSRKLSSSLGWFVTGIAFLMQGVFPLVPVVIAAQVVMGIGETLVSGAHDAWVADEIPHTDPGVTAGQAFVLGQDYAFWGRISGSWIALLASLGGLQLVLTLSGLGFFVFAVVTHFMMTERGFHRGNSERKFWATFRQGWSIVRTSQMLMLVLLVSVFYGFASEGFDRLWQKVLLDGYVLPKVGPFDDTFWWSVLGTASLLGGYAFNHVIKKRVDTSSARSITTALLVMTAVLIASLAGYALSTSLTVAVCLFVLSRALRRAMDPLLKTWTNLYATPEHRATILSFGSQAHSIGEIGGGPVVGTIGQYFTAAKAVMTAAFLLVPTLPVLFKARSKSD